MVTVAHPCCYFCWSWLATWADQAEWLFRMIHRSLLVSWWFINWVVVSNVFYFHPYLGKIPILTHIFQMGWNHQLVNFRKVVGTKDWSCLLLICSTLGLFLIQPATGSRKTLREKTKQKKRWKWCWAVDWGRESSQNYRHNSGSGFFKDTGISFTMCLGIIIWSKFMGGVFQLCLFLNDRKGGFLPKDWLVFWTSLRFEDISMRTRKHESS